MELIKDWGWAVLFVLGVLYMALRDKLGLDFMRRHEFDLTKYASLDDVNGMGVRIDNIEKLALGAHNMLGEAHRKNDDLKNRVEQIDKYGSAPMRELAETLSDLRSDMKEINIHLAYLRKTNGDQH